MLKSNLCDSNDPYFLIRGNITVTGHNVTQIALKNCASFIKRITKIGGTTIDDDEDLDLVLPMYNLLDTVRIILTRQVVYGFILKMKQLILIMTLRIPIILGRSSMKLNY